MYLKLTEKDKLTDQDITFVLYKYFSSFGIVYWENQLHHGQPLEPLTS